METSNAFETRKLGAGLAAGLIFIGGVACSPAERFFATCNTSSGDSDYGKAANAMTCSEVTFYTSDNDYRVAEGYAADIDDEQLKDETELALDKRQAAQAIAEASVNQYSDAMKRLEDVENQSIVALAEKGISHMDEANRVEAGLSDADWYEQYDAGSKISETLEAESVQFYSEVEYLLGKEESTE